MVGFRLAGGDKRFLEFFDGVQKVGRDGASPANVTSSLCDPNYDLWRRFSAGCSVLARKGLISNFFRF